MLFYRLFVIVVLISYNYYGISQSSTPDKYDRWIVKLNDHNKSGQLDQWFKSNVKSSEIIFEALDLYGFSLSAPMSLKTLRQELKKNQINIEIYPDREISWRQRPNDPDYPSQWGLEQINMPEVWDITTGGTAPNGDDIVVAIFDDGFDINHPDYQANIWTNQNEIPSNGIDDDGNGYIDDFLGWNATTGNDIHRLRTHGTAVAGIIGAIGNNGSQVAGVNWNVKMMLTSGGRNDNFNISDIVKAYQYVYNMRRLYNESRGARGAYVVVSNYSGGAPDLFPKDFPSWCEIYELLGQEGVLNFTSAPNKNVDVDVQGDLPSTCPSDYLIIVTNTDRSDQKAQNAGFGRVSVDIGAPGERIITTAINSEVNTDFSGASASAPFVAGVASLLYAISCESAFEESLDNPEILALKIREALLSQVKQVSSLEGITTSGGRLDAAASLKFFRSMKGIGDCCNITFQDIAVKDETCQQAADGGIIIQLDTTDIRGRIQYEISSSEGIEGNVTGEFNFLKSDNYSIAVNAQRDVSCRADTVVSVNASLDLCPFGEFQILNVWPNPTVEELNINFDLDELKNFELLIYNSAGQLVHRQLTVPDIGNRNEQINISHLPQGFYTIAMRGNDLWDSASFFILRD